MERIAVSELRARLAAVLDRIDKSGSVTVTRDGEDVAVMLPPQDAAWGLAVAGRFRDRRPPFTQPALDTWIGDVLAEMDLSDLMGADHG